MHKLKLTLAAILATLLLTGSTARPHVTIDETDDLIASWVQFVLEAASRPANSKSQLRAKYRAWNLLCFELRDQSCSGITPPNVRTFRQNPLRPGLAGYYDGTNIIYIRSDLYGKERLEVLAHEMSHFMDNELGLLPPMPVYNDDIPGIISLCTSEARAWLVSDNFQILYGNPRLVVGSDWTNWYTHCTPYKGILYPSGD